MQIGIGMQRRLGGAGGLVIPNSDELVSYTKPLLDSRGSSSRTVFKPISGLFAVGDYLTGDIASGTTVISEEGTGSISLSEDRLDYTDTEYLWSFVLSNGSIYEYPTIVDTDVFWFDLSGNERHLTATTADINAHTHEDDTLTFGSDWLNQMGWSAGGVVDEELWVDPTPQTIDENNYSTYDSETGTCRIVSSGTEVNLSVASVTEVGDIYVYVYTEISNNGGTVKASGVTPNKIFNAGSETATLEAGSTSIFMARAGTPCDVTFKLSVKKVYPATVPIPADITGLLDIIGNVLDYPGRAKYNLELVNNTATLQDGIDTIAFTELVGTETVISSVGTSTPTISAGQIDFTAGTCSMIVLSNGWTIPLEEGSGTSVYAYSGSNNYTGTVTASDINAFWSGEQDGENHNYLYGYELSGSVKVPANPNTGLSVLGNALTVIPKRLTDQIWQHPECADIRAIDVDCGNDYFYDSASSYTAFARSLTEWQALDGSDQVFQGPKGVAIYDTDQDADAQVKINKILGN